MRITITTKDWGGRPGTFAVDTAEQAVGYLWKLAFVRETAPDEYMAAVARRVQLFRGAVVRTSSAAEFLTDLAAIGLVTIVWEEDQ
jgi:hypothetical protein